MLKTLLGIATLFSSVGTLLCCALPALLVSLGMGAALVSAFSAVPQLIWFSEQKSGVFTVAGALLILTAILRRRAAKISCPADPALAASCAEAKSVSAVIFYVSIVLYGVGAFFAFIAPLFMG